MKIFFNTHLIQRHASKQQGFSLVELMVGLVIGLLMSLVVYNVLNVNEGRKRTTTSLNDVNQAGSYAIYQLDKQIRSAGSGFTSGGDKVGADYTFGCLLDMALSGGQLTPATTFPAPFASVGSAIRVAPVIIYDGAAGAGGDVIIAMSGNAGLGEAPTGFSSLATTATLKLVNQAGIRPNDVLLLADAGTSILPCLVQQVASTFIPAAGGSNVTLGGSYYSATVNSRSASDFTATSQAINLGQSPNLNMFAVGANNTLMRYDLMQARQTSAVAASPNPSVYVDSVYQLHALYGVDTIPASSSLTWVAPTGTFSAANLLTGTLAAAATLKRIKAIKIGVVMRTPLLERQAVSASTLQLFSDTTLPITVNLNPTTYRYRSFEAVIPLRNSLMLK
ncbi:PilW family protein [Methylotenera sp.]|uniref:PilW family protein n=1 Tax=Methylotenera sp. TaxID=2051956 RepID=UPI0024878D53|nr:PilW family protein [Methylotenera sp.]MDI1298854.1 PilW family protein [Methylotenera sp.]